MSANDIRSLENLDPIPEDEGGNLFLVNGNMCKLRDAGSAYQGQPAEGEPTEPDSAAPPYQPDETPEQAEEKPPESGNKRARKPRKELPR